MVAPRQAATEWQIEYEAGEQDGVVCDVHSHHRMGAFFSETDDGDEGGFRFYAVIGRVLDRPEIAVRLGMYGDFWEVPARAVFTEPGPFADRNQEIGESGDQEDDHGTD